MYFSKLDGFCIFLTETWSYKTQLVIILTVFAYNLCLN